MASITPFSGTLGDRLAKHLLRRTSYNITKTRIEEFKNYTVDQAIASLLVTPEKRLEQPIHFVNDTVLSPSPWINNDPVYGDVISKSDAGGEFRLQSYLSSWWLDEARRDTSIRSKMSYFLFTNFTASAGTTSANYYDYLKLLETFCLGNWKEFTYQVSINNRMLDFLNNDQNTNTNPNENFAREILELFTIGKGEQAGIGDYTNYTEKDVEEAAKVLSGWRSTKNNRGLYTTGPENGNLPRGYAVPNKHYFGRKEFSHRFSNYVIEEWDTTNKTEEEKVARIESELREFITLVLDQSETAKYVCRKLYRFFVSRKITLEIENDIISPLATIFRVNYNLEETITTLLKSKHFYDSDDNDSSNEIIGGLIKPPIELLLHTLTMIDYPVPDPIDNGKEFYLDFFHASIKRHFLEKAAQAPFTPNSVAGFPANYEAPDYDKLWFNSATIIPRFNLMDLLIKNSIANFSITTFVESNISVPSDSTILVRELTDLIFPETIDTNRLNYFVNDILLDNGNLTPLMWEDEWNTYKNSNDSSVVEDALKPLLRAVAWSQEYQTY